MDMLFVHKQDNMLNTQCEQTELVYLLFILSGVCTNDST